MTISTICDECGLAHGQKFEFNSNGDLVKVPGQKCK